MNLDGFFQILADNAERVEWFVHDCGFNRCPRHVLRCRVVYQKKTRDGQTQELVADCCPVTAACLIETEQVFRIDYYRVAGYQLLGLFTFETTIIAEVSDNIACPGRTEIERKIRRSLLELAKLSDSDLAQLRLSP